MRRFLLALPLFLVVGLAFVELPNGNGAQSNISNQNVSSTVTASPNPLTSAPQPTTIGPTTATKPENGESGHKRRPPHSNEDFEEHDDEDDDFEEDED